VFIQFDAFVFFFPLAVIVLDFGSLVLLISFLLLPVSCTKTSWSIRP